MKRSLARYCADLVKPFSEEEPAEHRRVRPKREGLRRIAVFAAAPLGLYAALVVVSLLGGPRIGAPFIPLPGADKPGPVSPVAGVPLTGQAMEVFPPIPRHSPTPSPLTSTPTMDGPDQLVEPTTAAGSPTLTVTPTPTTAPTTIIEPDDRRSIAPPSTWPVDRPDPSKPPVTRTPPPPTAHPTPTSPQSTPTEPPGDPDEPDQPTLTDTLRNLLRSLGQ